MWTKWLATSLGAMYEHTQSQRGHDGGALLAPRAFNTANPFLNGDWANSSTFLMDRTAGKKHAYRANAVITNELFGGRAKSQTVVGYDLNFSSGGNTNYRYDEADGNFRVYDLTNPRPVAAGGNTGANQLGRVEMGTITWSVNNGPQKKPYFRIGTRQVTVNGKNYVLLRPRDSRPARCAPAGRFPRFRISSTTPPVIKGALVESETGEPTIGHPLYRFVWTNTYDFTNGFLRGITVGGPIRWDIDKRTYWYNEPDGKGGTLRFLCKETDVNPQVSPFVAYRRKIGRFGFRTQVNVNNAFNKYAIDLRPSRATGFTVENAIGATFVGEPRQYVWTNTISF